MSARKPFQTTALLYEDGSVEIMGSALRYVREEAKTREPKARAIVLREVVRKPLRHSRGKR